MLIEMDHGLAQTQEVEALQAIYGGDFEERPGIWNFPAFAIKVRPVCLIDEGVNAWITLAVKYSKSYPSTVPSLELSDRRGISEAEQQELLGMLIKKAQEHIGEVMVYELILQAEDFLVQKTRKESIYDEMQQRQEAERREREEAEKAEAEAAEEEERARMAQARREREKYEQSVAIELARRKGRREGGEKEEVRALHGEGGAGGGGEDDDSAGGETSDEEEDEEGGIEGGVGLLRGGLSSSRYESDFRELGALGRGGSGQVVKVRNRLDKRLYAVKKIELDAMDREVNRKLRREVTTISRMYHKNIVRYYQAWVESQKEGEEGEEEEEEEEEEETEDDHGTGEIILDDEEEEEEEDEDDPRWRIGGRDVEERGNEGKTGKKGKKGKRRRSKGHRGEPLVVFGEMDEDADDDDEEEDGMEEGSQSSQSSKGGRRRRSRGRKEGGKGGAQDEESDSSDDSSSEEEKDNEEEAEEEDSEESGLMDLLNPMARAPERGELSWSFSSAYCATTPTPSKDATSTAAVVAADGGDEKGIGKESSSALAATAITPGKSLLKRDGAQQQQQQPRKPLAKKHLYIQMEYCAQTLRSLIDGGKLYQSLPECWRLLRQMLEALVYIHKKGIIHRDIKPANVFLDGEGNVKVGDFGLATTDLRARRGEGGGGGGRVGVLGGGVEEGNDGGDSQGHGSSSEKRGGEGRGEETSGTEPSSLARLSLGETFGEERGWEGVSESITGGVGTYFYIAPEQQLQASGTGGTRYDTKADMYSLGIIWFEMTHPPFATMMERAKALTALRTQQQLPADFLTLVPPLVSKTILQLVAPIPSLRPSAAFLLASGELPGKMEVEEVYLKEALGTLTNPQSLSYGRLVRALFTHGNPPEVEATWDLDWVAAHKEEVGARELAGKEAVCEYVRTVFQLHGALPLSVPLLRPRPTVVAGGGGEGQQQQQQQQQQQHGGGGGREALDYLDLEGAVLRLPTELLVPFARYVARTEVSHMKRYELSRVYHRQDAGGGHPKEELSAQMDVVCDGRHAAGQGEILEAEVLWAAGQVVRGVLGQPYLVRLNSVHLMQGTLELLDVPMEGRRAVWHILEGVCMGVVGQGQGKAVGLMVESIPCFAATGCTGPGKGSGIGNGSAKAASGSTIPPKPLQEQLPNPTHHASKEGVKRLLTRLLEAGKDPFAALQAIEDVLSSLPQVQAVLMPSGAASAGGGGGGGGAIGGPQHAYSRKELKRLRLACKGVSESLLSLRTLLHYLHALGMLPLTAAVVAASAAAAAVAVSSALPSGGAEKSGARRVASTVHQRAFNGASAGHTNSSSSSSSSRSNRINNRKGKSGGDSITGGGASLSSSPSSSAAVAATAAASSTFSMSPKEPTYMMESSLLRGPRGVVGPLECSHAPAAVILDLGLYRRKSHYNSGLIFQIIVSPSHTDGFPSFTATPAAATAAIDGPNATLSSSSSSLSRQATAALHRYQRHCVIEGGRYDGLILEHRTPAQWASPLVMAMGMTVAIEKLTHMALQPPPSTNTSSSITSSGLASSSSFSSVSALSTHTLGELLPPSLEIARRASSCAGPPDVLICSMGSGLGAGGMPDRLLVACVLWSRGIKADYCFQDLWRKRGREGGMVELSMEEATTVCLNIGIPYLVMIKAHVLREKQAVKLRAVREGGVPDRTIPLQELARRVLERLSNVGGEGEGVRANVMGVQGGQSSWMGGGGEGGAVGLHHFGHHHHHHHGHGQSVERGGGGGGVEVSLSCLDTKHTQHAAGGDRRKAFKEMAALERRVRAHIQGMVGHPFVGSGPQREPVVVLAMEVPYMVIRMFCTVYLRVGAEEALRDPWVSQQGGAHKRSIKLLAEALEEEEGKQLRGGGGGGQGRKGSGGGAGGGGGGGSVYVYSIPEDCFDVVPLLGGRGWGHVGLGGGGGGGGMKRGGEKR